MAQSFQLENCADWHADAAIAAYRNAYTGSDDDFRERNLSLFCRHIRICDDLRNRAAVVRRIERKAA
jgi:hypothetical protein